MYISGPNVPNVRPEWHAEKRPIRAFSQRLKGKQGRFRGNLSGKRVDFSGRTVISPDPNLGIDELCVPIQMARVFTYPQRVFAHNLSALRKLVLNGPDNWPGANFVEFADDKFKRSLRYYDKRRAAAELKVGDIVERHLSDGDVVLFNRQPSLHKLSIMAHRARVMHGRTLRFNECVCAPYNADFDGDEMNMHLPQTEEARAESLTLLGVCSNLVTPRNGTIVVSATQDFLTGAWLLSLKSVFLTRDQFCRLAVYMGDANERVEIPCPAILKPVELWTGKQLFSLMLRPTSESALSVYLEGPSKQYNQERVKPEPLHMCPDDGYVCFQASEHICGVLDKSLLGGGSKSSLFAVLLRDHSAEASALAMGRLAKLTSRFLMDHGFSIGIADVQPTARLTDEKGQLLDRGYKQCKVRIDDFDAGNLTPSPGCTPEQTLESELNGLLSKIRDDAGDICKKELHSLNAPLTMAKCGSKGSFINISQMIACVGQQSVGGKRMPNGFVHRALPHFPRHSLEPAAKGFVANSFYTGLSPTEFFFHTMGGREGLVDTAVKTAETGYIARRLMKALEDLTVQYDGSVRNSESNLVQFKYGDDGLDPAAMEGTDGKTLAFTRVLLAQRRLTSCSPSAQHTPLTLAEIRQMLDEHCASHEFTSLIKRSLEHVPARYETDLRAFVETLAKQHARLEGYVEPHELPFATAGQNGKAGTMASSVTQTQAAKQLPTSRGRKRRAVVESDEEEQSDACKDAAAESVEGSSVQGIAARMAAPSPVKQEVHDIQMLEGAAKDSKDMKAGAVKIEEASKAGSSRRRGGSGSRSVVTQGEYNELDEGALTTKQRDLQRLSREQMLGFFATCLRKYRGAVIEPGSAVGAVGAQSIGEPGTQMTLKTFHFAGVASMNITLGVPRIKEIINAAKTISTPVIRAELLDPYDESSARAVKGRLERTELGGICTSISEVIDLCECYIEIVLDRQRINDLHLDVNAYRVRSALLAQPKLKLQPADLIVEDDVELKVLAGRGARDQNALFELHRLRQVLKTVVVCGIKDVTRAIITLKDDNEKSDEEKRSGQKCHKILVEGAGLQAVMGVKGVRGEQTRSTHIMEVEKTLGIEAARRTIVEEIADVMRHHGMDIDARHVALLADVMCFRGEVLGITRFGVPKMKQSVLMLASFEKTTDHLFEAAVHARTDSVAGASECIIMGIPIPLGTGIFKLLQRMPKVTLPKVSAPLFPSCEKHLTIPSRVGSSGSRDA